MAKHETAGFYDELSPDDLLVLSGADRHYHHGLFIGDCSFAEALCNAVTSVYRFLPPSPKVLDLGCGWGGPARMFQRDLGASVTAVTSSERQFKFVSGLGLHCIHHDLEEGLPDFTDQFDVAVFFESLEHIRNKVTLYEQLRNVAGRIVVRSNCVAMNESDKTFGASMVTVTPQDLRADIQNAGWNVIFQEDIRQRSLPSLFYWRKTILDAYGPAPSNPHIAALLEYASVPREQQGRWARFNPLVTLVADPA